MCDIYWLGQDLLGESKGPNQRLLLFTRTRCQIKAKHPWNYFATGSGIYQDSKVEFKTTYIYLMHKFKFKCIRVILL